MKTKKTYRTLAAVLALLVLLGQFPVPARAAETTGLCEHHPTHENCGYVEGDPDQPCTFQCDQCAQEPTTGAPDSTPPACVCTDKCTAESANPDCPVCAADVTQCAGQEPTATDNLATPTATGIQVTTPPAKTQYQLQEPLDLTGGVLTVTYSDGSTQDMDITQDMVSGFKNDTACTLTLTVTWGGFEAYFDVTVLQPQTVSEEKAEAALSADAQSTAQIDWIATGEMNAPEISCPHSETIQIDVPQENVRFYTFTPQESGSYILSWETEAGLDFEPTVSYTDADGNTGALEPNVLYDGRRGYTLESGIRYTLRFKFYLYDDGAASGTFRLEKEAGMTGIKIRGGDRTVPGADGERLHGGSIYVDFYPENAIGEVTWESSAPEVAEVLTDAYDVLITYGQGTAVITARCGEFSDSVTITVQKPEELVLGQTIQGTSDGMGPYYYAFTPPETGRYAIAYECEVSSDVLGYFVGFGGRYMPEDYTYSSNNSGDVIHGTFTAGVTYYYQVAGPVRWTITVKKEEEKPVAMNVHCSSYYSNEMHFNVEFVPSNSYDDVVSWESSDPEILDIKYGYSTGCNAYIYGTGEVTVTAISAGGLRASCTVTVGQCDSGHTYGPWRQTREPGCTIDGLETATCICGLRQYRSIPATGHTYDNNCDPDCNVCGETRTVEHSFSQGWAYSETAHWHVCTVCGERSQIENHVPGPAATATTPQLCAVCGYVLQKATGQTTIIQQTVTNSTGHTHRYDTRLTMDEDGHWYACSGCATRKDYERHRYTDDCDPDCNVCGYTRTVSHNAGAEWASDGTGHWYPCLDCGEKLSFAEHRMENGVCTVCGYTQQEEQPPATQPPEEPTAPAASDGGAGGTDTAARSQGIPWWMLLVVGLVSSAATLTVAGAVLWLNRKKIAALFIGK